MSQQAMNAIEFGEFAQRKQQSTVVLKFEKQCHAATFVDSRCMFSAISIWSSDS
jgi:hypothetical protein